MPKALFAFVYFIFSYGCLVPGLFSFHVFLFRVVSLHKSKSEISDIRVHLDCTISWTTQTGQKRNIDVPLAMFVTLCRNSGREEWGHYDSETLAPPTHLEPSAPMLGRLHEIMSFIFVKLGVSLSIRVTGFDYIKWHHTQFAVILNHRLTKKRWQEI